MLNQMIKRREVVDIDKTFYDLLTRLDYFSMLRSWEDVFGKENLSIRLYDNVDDVTVDFYSIIGVPAFDNPTRPNEDFPVKRYSSC